MCQLGGSNPTQLAQAARMVARYGYDEINLNCGCPSDRVAGAGCFGAALMLQPETVAACAAAVNAATPTPLTIKCRLGTPAPHPPSCCWPLKQLMCSSVARRRAWRLGFCS